MSLLAFVFMMYIYMLVSSGTWWWFVKVEELKEMLNRLLWCDDCDVWLIDHLLNSWLFHFYVMTYVNLHASFAKQYNLVLAEVRW